MWDEGCVAFLREGGTYLSACLHLGGAFGRGLGHEEPFGGHLMGDCLGSYSPGPKASSRSSRCRGGCKGGSREVVVEVDARGAAERCAH